MTKRLSIEFRDGVADVRLSRPDKLNALDMPMLEALSDAPAQLAAQPALRAVVLSGEGLGFCAGLDMETMAGLAGAGLDIVSRTHDLANLFQQTAWGWRTLPFPVIAAGHGMVFGGGLQVFSGADIRIARPDTRLSVMELKWGLVPDMAGFALWRGLVRDDVLRELIYTAREFTGEQAVELGFVTRLADAPHAEALTLAREIAARNPDAVRGAKRLANLARDEGAGPILLSESVEQAALIATPNQVEAVMANLQKRPAKFAD